MSPVDKKMLSTSSCGCINHSCTVLSLPCNPAWPFTVSPTLPANEMLLSLIRHGQPLMKVLHDSHAAL